MPEPYERLASAYENERRPAVTETDGTVHEECVVDDFVRARTDHFEVWRFALRDLYGDTTLFGVDLESVEVLD